MKERCNQCAFCFASAGSAFVQYKEKTAAEECLKTSRDEQVGSDSSMIAALSQLTCLFNTC